MKGKKSKFFRKALVSALTVCMLTGSFAGCGEKGGKSIPTPTPRVQKEKEPTKEPTATQAPMLTEGSVQMQPAASYEAVYAAIEKVRDSAAYGENSFLYIEDNWFRDEAMDFVTNGMGVQVPEVEAVPDSSVTTGAADKSEGSFSSTNVQVEGVDEADIIKTDGKYFYVFNGNRNEIYIVSAKGGAMELTAVIPVKEQIGAYDTGREMYLLDDRLVLVASGYRMELIKEPAEVLDKKVDPDYYYDRYRKEKQVTKLLTYDISDASAPKLLSVLEQDGSLISSRCTGGKVYTITTNNNYFDWYYVMDEEENATDEFIHYIPQVNGARILPECIYISEEPMTEEFLVVTAMNPEKPKDYVDVKSLMADGDRCYVSSNYIYVASTRWQNMEYAYDRTELYRFAYADGVITPAGQVTVKGTLNDQFSMDEYDGKLRIVTTVNEYVYKTKDIKVRDFNGDGVIDDADKEIAYYRGASIVSSKESNSLYIYNEGLQLIGSIENLAENEEIKSARLMGTVGYFVTFRQTDPLFSVDLSDPTAPKVLGELKIPGFSAYLHPYGEDLLLGIGYDADESTGWTQGVKLSMFDVSDPGNVKEIHKVILPEFSTTAVAANHKAALVDAEKNIIGFPARGYGDNGEYNVYLVYGYDKETGFTKKFSEGYAMDWSIDWYEFKYEYFYSDCRGAYIDDTFYMINPSYEIRAFSMDTWEACGREGLVKEVEERMDMLEKIETVQPEPVVIELEGNPTTGYTWNASTEGGAVDLASIETLQKEGTEDLVGAPVIQRFTFVVADVGTSTVTLEYARVWESKAPLKKVVYVISVDENLKATIESVTEE